MLKIEAKMVFSTYIMPHKKSSGNERKASFNITKTVNILSTFCCLIICSNETIYFHLIAANKNIRRNSQQVKMPSISGRKLFSTNSNVQNETNRLIRLIFEHSTCAKRLLPNHLIELFVTYKKFYYQHKNGHVTMVLAKLSITQNKINNTHLDSTHVSGKVLIDIQTKTI